MTSNVLGAGHALVLLLVAGALIQVLSPTRALGQAPILPGAVSSGTLSFDGHASLGDFTGTTTVVSGAISGGPTLASVRGWVEAPVRTLTTGKHKRDADLNKSMESDRFQNIRYELDSLTPKFAVGDTAIVILHGRFVIHGVTRETDLPARVLFWDGGARVWSDTPLNLTDYRIGGLSKLLGVLTMHEVIAVHIDVQFATD